MGLCYSCKGESYQEAERTLNKSLAIKEKTFGKNHPEMVFDLSNLAWLYYWQSQHKKAEEKFSQILEIRKKTLGEKIHNVNII